MVLENFVDCHRLSHCFLLVYCFGKLIIGIFYIKKTAFWVNSDLDTDPNVGF